MVEDKDVFAAIQCFLVLPRLPHDMMEDALVDIVIHNLEEKGKYSPSLEKLFSRFQRAVETFGERAISIFGRGYSSDSPIESSHKRFKALVGDKHPEFYVFYSKLSSRQTSLIRCCYFYVPYL